MRKGAKLEESTLHDKTLIKPLLMLFKEDVKANLCFMVDYESSSSNVSTKISKKENN